MSQLIKRKSKLVFTTSDTARYKGSERQIIIEATPFYAVCRLAGTRTRYEMSWAGIFNFAAAAFANKERAERKANRKGAIR
jgi:hypothetical protein